MNYKKLLVAATCIGCLTNPALADRNENWGIGLHALVGFADNDNLRQLPTQTGTLSSNTDGIGTNGGAGAWVSYNLEDATDLPITVELSSTWRYRHDFNLNYTFSSMLFGAKLDVMTIDTMLSGLYHFDTGTDFTPYIGGGVGVAYHSSQNQHIVGGTNIDVGDTTDVNLAYQVQAGLNYELGDNWDLRLDYRYIDLGEVGTTTMPTSGSRFTTDLFSHDIRIGALWYF